MRQYLDDTFLRIASDILGETNKGLSTTQIIDKCNSFGYEYNVDIPISNLDKMKYRNIPFINMAIALYGGISYKTNRDNILLTLNTTDCFEKMTKEEEEYYSKNPNAFTAVLINKGKAIKKPSTIKMPVDPNLTFEERMAMKEEMEKLAQEIPNVQNFITGKEIVKVIVVPKKIVNIVIKNLLLKIM